MLSELQCKQIESALREDAEPRRAAAFLCLSMGLTLAEVSALRFEDLDLARGAVSLSLSMGKGAGGELVCLPAEQPRVLPMPPQALEYMRARAGMYKSGACFIMSGEEAPPALHRLQNLMASLRLRCAIGEPLSVSDLRNAFIRRCIQAGMDLYSLCCYVGIRQPNVLFRRFEEYFTPRFEVLERLGVSAPPEKAGPRQMDLLILGAGSQGPVVKEIAQAIGIFHDIQFLDDDPHKSLAIGPLSACSRLISSFPMAIPSFGDSRLREKYMDMLDSLGYVVPTLIHPSATVSPNARIERSAVIEARCVISANAVIGHGAIVSSAAIVEYGARVGQFCHIGSSVTVTKGAQVADYVRVPAGDTVK